MGIKLDLEAEVQAIFKTRWSERDGRKVPEPEDVKLGNDAVKLDGTVLYADLAESTNLVKGYHWWFAAEVYKAYLVSACRLIRQNGGVITAFDGDRVMAVYFGDGRDPAAVRTALQINWIVGNVINPKIKQNFPDTTFAVSQSVGIDRSTLRAVRTGIRGSNDLVWVGNAANYAAKMSSISAGYPTYISRAVYDNLDAATRTGGSPVQNMWSEYNWVAQGMTVLRSNWHWEP